MADIELGTIVATRGVAEILTASQANGEAVGRCIDRHRQGDWGVVDAEDAQRNNDAVENGGRLLSAYDIDDTRIWIITEADRSVTTLMLPEEY